jgi:hypothetical protein
MRKWGVVITGFYGLIVLAFVPLISIGLVKPDTTRIQQLTELYRFWGFWLFAAVLVGGEALLLFLSVDTQHKKLKPRAHVLLSAALAAAMIAMLSGLLLVAVWLAGHRDNFQLPVFGDNGLLLVAALWVLWAGVFYLYLLNTAEPVNKVVSWLLRGSVLEVLVVVPCHVWVRRRDDCSAPGVTAFGIATGLAIMLLSFGPGVLLLFKKRLDSYSAKGKAAAQ